MSLAQLNSTFTEELTVWRKKGSPETGSEEPSSKQRYLSQVPKDWINASLVGQGDPAPRTPHHQR